MAKKNKDENLNEPKDNSEKLNSAEESDTPVSEDPKTDEFEINNEVIAQLNLKIDDYKFTAQRIQAEFENYRKRNEEIKNSIKSDTINEIIQEFLLVLDSINSALKIVQEGSAKEGINLIAKQFYSLLTKYEVEEIDPENEAFNPLFHNAVMQEENPEKVGTVVQVFQKGYKRKGKVIRFATVKVAV
ncbi:MAG: nucleotide exchange factor GrpE [Clostridia bacterium]|jgi:molecular chaperone GrpE|nr:nucleotide exchange factor GrpE [Clostridia bacterium]